MTALRWLVRALAAIACGVLLVAGVILGLSLVGICVAFGALAESVDPGGLVVETKAGKPRRPGAPTAMNYRGGRIHTDAPPVTGNTAPH